MERATWIEKPGLDDLVATNSETRRITKLLIENKK
jgi:hypothetical protein